MHTNTDFDHRGACIQSQFDQDGLVGDQPFFYYWILEREKCRMGRESNGALPKPWSNDPILQNNRFCNVRREDDVVTKWIHDNWLKPNDMRDDVTAREMLVAVCAARLFNRVSTLQHIGFPRIRGNPVDGFRNWIENARLVLKEVRETEPIWTGAYLVSTNGHKMDKVDYILDKVLTPIANNCPVPDDCETLQSYHKKLTAYDGMGSFMAGQVIADLKFSSLFDPQVTMDWWTWAPIGPGSKRGLNRYFGRKLEQHIGEKQVLEELRVVQLQVATRLGIHLAVHNIQNCFCEYDKFLRIMKGEGKSRSRYNGTK